MAARQEPDDHLLRVPTGQGKTLGCVAAWAWHRLVQRDPTWPRRLVWVLPTRVLVEQVSAEIERFLASVARTGGGTASPVHLLMGGADTAAWHLEPERDAVLVGTQDMILSRALNRGYAVARGRWPMEFALLHTDALWVLDEVQLMDVGLASSVALHRHVFPQDQDGPPPRRMWWMSATVRAHWFDVGADGAALAADRWSRRIEVAADQQHGPEWQAQKDLHVEAAAEKPADFAAWMADRAVQVHGEAMAGEHGRITLVVVNTVDTAIDVHARIVRHIAATPTGSAAPECVLLHSRFRPYERAQWRERWLAREHCNPSADRILVATQVVEAGVDLTASGLVTELAPWSSVVQRAGRAARYGGTATVVIADRGDEVGGPYAAEELAAAREALAMLDGIGLADLEEFESQLSDDPGFARRLQPYEPAHVLSAKDVRELFDTTPDLTGGEVDVSRYIRSGDQRDLLLQWFTADGAQSESAAPEPTTQPCRAALCPVSITAARKWLIGGSNPPRAFTWNYLEGRWQRLRQDHLRPGVVVMVDARDGGYDPARGFTGERLRRNTPPLEVVQQASANQSMADSGQFYDDISEFQWKTIATHGSEVAAELLPITAALTLSKRSTELLHLAARLHDWGKAHPAFQSAIKREQPGHPGRDDLAKAPPGAWQRGRRVYDHAGNHGPRPGFRHELASALACFELLSRQDPQHPALLGDWAELLCAGLLGPDSLDSATAGDSCAETVLGTELAALTASEFDVVVFLVAAHHGKVRARLHASAEDARFPLHRRDFRGDGLPIRGVRERDQLPPVELASADGSIQATPGVALSLAPAAMGLSSRFGRSWTERVDALLDRHGPADLALLETLLRVADVRASRRDSADPLLTEVTV